MTIGLRPIPQSELVRRAIERTGENSWLGLVVPEGRLADVVEQVTAGIASESDLETFRVDEPMDAESLARDGRRPGILIASLADTWPPGSWARLDALRSRLQRKHASILVMTEAAARHVFREAPHFVRLFTGSIWDLVPDADAMSDAELQARVASLEQWAKLSTPEMIARAEAKTLPPDPEYAEWLLLVGRSDLL